MIQIADKEKYLDEFLAFKYFNNYIKFALKDLDCTLYADDLQRPKCMVMHAQPAYFIAGDPAEADMAAVFSTITEGGWIVPCSTQWGAYIQSHYKEKLQSFKRVLFDASELDSEKIRSMKKPLPAGLRIEKIAEKHLQKGMIYDEVVCRFFTVSDFMAHGFGFALMDDNDVCQGFALTNFPAVDKDVELYFRVGYDSSPLLRNQGLGTNLCAHFIEYCLENGYIPQWDAATDVSAHIARKLGYVEREIWEMYHVE